MGEIGGGTGTSFPGALDTDSTLEVNSPSANKTRARAEVINDVIAAVVAIETELGTDPAGTLADIKTFLQKEHNTDGTHVGTVNVETYASFAAAVSSIGSTEKVLFINTNRTVSSAVTVPSTLHVIMRGAGKFTKSGSGTITFSYGPFDAPHKQVFSGFSSGDITGLPETNPAWWGAKGDGGTTDNSTAILAANTAGPTYVKKESSYYKITSAVALTNPIWSDPGSARAEIRQATTATKGFTIAVSNISVSHLKITGAQAATDNSSEIAVHATGTNDSTRIENITVDHCEISTWGFEGVRYDYVDRAHAFHNYVHDIVYSGIQGRHTNWIDFSHNEVEDITPGTGGVIVGISVTGTVSQATAPKFGTISHNTVKNISSTNGEGILIEPAEHIGIIDNTVIDCYLGIVAGEHPTGGVIKSCTISKNRIINLALSTMASRKAGILLGGRSAAVPNLNNLVTDNTIVGYGTNSPSVHGALHLYYNKGSLITGNNLHDSYVVGIELLASEVNSLISGNNINGMNASGATAGIHTTNGANNYTFIDGNNINSDSGTGIELSAADGLLRIGKNQIKNTAAHDFYAASFAVNEEFHRDTTDVTVTGTTVATDLKSVVISGNSMMKHQGFRIVAAGTKTGSAGNKTITLNWGSETFTVHAAANNTNDWRIEAEIINDDGTGVQNISWTCWDGATITQGFEIAGQDTTANVTFELQGTLANGADSIVQKSFIQERF